MIKPVAFLALFAATPAIAQVEDSARAELLGGWREGGQHIAALKITLKPGWKTYWRAPGDAGIPPVFVWDGSRNIDVVEVEYPVPKVFDQGGMRSVGYEGSVVFPLILDAQNAGAPIALQGQVTIGVCEDICVPVSFAVAGDLAAGGVKDPVIQAARSSGAIAGGAMDCRISPIDDGLRLEVQMAAPDMGSGMFTIIETADPSVWVSQPEIVVAGGRMTSVSDLVPPDAVPFALERGGLRVTHLAGGQAVEMVGCN